MSLVSSNQEDIQLIMEIEIPQCSSDFVIDDPEIISILETQSGQMPISIIDADNEQESQTANVNHEHGSSSSSCSEPMNTRKRIRKSDNWKINQRRKDFQAGKEFVNHRGVVRPKREIKNLKDCKKACKLQCSNNLSETERSEIFKNYYSLDQAGKYYYIASTTQRIKAKRKSVKEDTSRRANTFYYYFNIYGNRIPVCKKFYLGTLSISQKPIYTVHQKMNSSGTVSNSAKGTTSSRKISKEQVDAVLDHIASFPCIESHYCREKTKKKYLDSNLNVTKMFDLYVTKCDELRTVPVKESFYRSTFNTKFNLEFFKPKSDRCAVCELHKIDASRLNEGVYETHDVLKSTMRELKSKDKESGIPILCFDMQEVITCPKSNIDSSYYLSKLNIYNMTAHLSTTKTVYCAMWNEAAMGRTGNDLASALYKILERVFSDNDITQLITWSDSCVPQNKNSYMAYAIQHFLKSHPQISSIEMRYSLPGHSCIQEVDNAHSLIERVISRNEFFSPIGLVRLMKTINRKKPYIIIQLNNEDFKNFEIPSKNFNYKAVPFASLRMLGFDNNNLCIVRYNSTYSLENWQEVSIRPTIKYTRVNSKPQKNYQVVWLDPPISSSKKPIPIAKILDIQKMFQFMGSQDLVYYKTILKIRN